MHGAVGAVVSEETSIGAPGRGGRFAGALAFLIALMISLPAQAQMAGPPMNTQNMRGAMPGQMANPMMMPNNNGKNGNMNGGMGNNTNGMNGMNGNMGGTMMNPSMRMPYMQRMPNQGGGATPPSGQRTTPSFVGLTRSEASALAAQYGLAAAFDGSTSENARVASQAPEAGVLIFRSAMPIRFQMEAQASRPPAQTPAPAGAAPEPQAASPAPPEQAAPLPSAPPAAAAKPAPARTLTTPPATPATPPRNWWILAAIAAGLAGAMWLLFGWRKKPEPAGFNTPPAGGMAQLATQIVSTGLAEATVSLGGAAAPRFELRYVVEHDAHSDQIGISVGGGKDGG